MRHTPMQEQCFSSINTVLQIMSGKWSFLVLGQLYIHGTMRFNQLRKNLEPVSTKSLTDILRHLEHNGMIERHVFPTVPVTVQYSLTDKGEDFKHVLQGMNSWRSKWMLE
jgi:DNA-binding HxlR family transcriptional regulator